MSLVGSSTALARGGTAEFWVCWYIKPEERECFFGLVVLVVEGLHVGAWVVSADVCHHALHGLLNGVAQRWMLSAAEVEERTQHILLKGNSQRRLVREVEIEQH